MFKFIDYRIPECEQINSDSGRKYKTPDGNVYPSVTTVLGTVNVPYLLEWKMKVGEANAKKISEAAAARGTRVHSWCEGHLKGIQHIVPYTRMDEFKMFQNMIPELDKFEEVHALEQRLWSDKLRVAGTVDCIAKIDGKMYIVDFKTSTGMKTRYDIDSYFMQVAAYSVAWYERTGMLISNSRVIITTQDDGVFVFDEPVKEWVGKFAELRKTCEI